VPVVALRITSAPISEARREAAVSVEKKALPVPYPKITTFFSRRYEFALAGE